MLAFFLFAGICALLLGQATWQPRRFYEYPYFMAATFAVFILPQAYALLHSDWGGYYLEKLLVFSTMSLAACWIGYELPGSGAILNRIAIPVSAERFLHGGFALVVVGYFFTALISRLPEEVRSESTWTGIITVYAFFSQLVYPGFAICLYCYLQSRDVRALVATLLAAWIPLQAAIFYARREPTALFILTVALSFYFLRGKVVPRWLAISSIVAAVFIIPATGQYRSLAEKDPLEALKSIDVSGEWQRLNDDDAISEVKNATILIAATDMREAEKWGVDYWNVMVFRFVPAQFLGKEFKDSLIIGSLEDTAEKLMEDVFGFAMPVGSTITGIGDAYYQFGMLGCAVFGLAGWLFRILWEAAHGSNGTIAQVLYIQTMTCAMRAVTNQTTDFLPGFVYSLIFIGLISVYALDRNGVAHDGTTFDGPLDNEPNASLE